MIAVVTAVFWKSGVALGAALAINRLLRYKSADLRRLVLSTAIVAIFVAAAALPFLPRWNVITGRPAAIPAVSEQSTDRPAFDNTEGAPDTAPAPVQTPSRRVDLRPWLIPLFWFAGTTILLVRLAINLYGLHRLGKASDPFTDAGLPTSAARFGRRV